MIYLKKFQNHTAYETYVSTDYPKPNVSCCVQENEVHYNPIPPFFCKLTLNNGDVVKIEGSGELTSAMTSSYSGTCVSAEIGTLCTSIGISAFRYCSKLENITIPSSVTIIGQNAFNNCTSLTSVTIGSGVTIIGNYAFRYCSKLANITIPSSVTSIGRNVFDTCTSLTSATIGSGVTSIGNSAFNGCRHLMDVTVQTTTPPTLGSNAFNNTNNCPIYVPSESVDTYKAATNWSTYADRINPIQTT